MSVHAELARPARRWFGMENRARRDNCRWRPAQGAHCRNQWPRNSAPEPGHTVARCGDSGAARSDNLQIRIQACRLTRVPHCHQPPRSSGSAGPPQMPPGQLMGRAEEVRNSRLRCMSFPSERVRLANPGVDPGARLVRFSEFVHS